MWNLGTRIFTPILPGEFCIPAFPRTTIPSTLGWRVKADGRELPPALGADSVGQGTRWHPFLPPLLQLSLLLHKVWSRVTLYSQSLGIVSLLESFLMAANFTKRKQPGWKATYCIIAFICHPGKSRNTRRSLLGEGLGDVYLQMRSTWGCLKVRELFCLGYSWSQISQIPTPTRQISLYVNYKVKFQNSSQLDISLCVNANVLKLLITHVWCRAFTDNTAIFPYHQPDGFSFTALLCPQHWPIF